MSLLPFYMLCIITTASAKCQYQIKPNNLTKVICSSIDENDIKQEVSIISLLASLKSVRAGSYEFTFLNSSISVFPNKLFTSLPKDSALYLYINNSRVGGIQTAAFVGLPEVREIYLQSNLLSMISRGWFNYVPKLRVLDVSHNYITFLEVNAFNGSTDLRKIFLNDNIIRFVPRLLFYPLKQLQYVNLTNNIITTLDISFKNFAVFKRVSLNNNRIDRIDCETLHESYIDILELENNRLREVDGGCLPKIAEEVVLKTNVIKSVSNTSLLTSLKFLDFSYNSIEALENDEFENLKKVERLELQQNEMTYLSPGLFKDLQSLALLNLSGNSIKSLSFGVFNSLQNLNNLDLSYNQLEVLEEDVFHNLNSLKFLNVSYNQLQYINLIKLKAFSRSFEQIDLIGNNMSCQKLTAMFSYKLNIQIAHNFHHNVSNVNGIPCYNFNTLMRSMEAIKFNANTFRDMKNLFDLDFKNTSIYKFFMSDARNYQNYGSSVENFTKYLQHKDVVLLDKYSRLTSQVSKNNIIFIILALIICLFGALMFAIIVLLKKVLKHRFLETRGHEMTLL